MSTITKANINMLFEDLWPSMISVQEHKSNCLKQFEAILNYFKKSSDHNQLLKNLCSLDGIKVTIGTGLIWSAYPDSRVPFDKYTLNFALNKKILRTENVSSNYILCSGKVKSYCDDQEFTIKDFVRDAWIELDGYEFLIDPI